MQKKKILSQLIDKTRRELDGLKEAYESTHSHMTDDDLKSEGKYDTRGIEAGYLAGAQKVRLEELEGDLHLLEEIEIREFDPSEEVAIGALVELELNGNRKSYFISPTAGGTMLEVEGSPVLVISVFSPIGAEVMALKAGDEFELETKGDPREYLVVSVK